MEAALLSGFIKTILPRLLSLGHQKYKLQDCLKDDITYLERELSMIAVTIDEQIVLGKEDPGAVHSLSMEALRELAFQIEDCVDRFMYHVNRGQQAGSILHRVIRSIKLLLSCQKLAAEVHHLKKVPEEVHQRQGRYRDFAAASPSSQHAGLLSSSWCGSYPHTPKSDLVGIDAPRNELVEQLAEEANGQPKQLKVISIVGIHGSGKTVLAREVYESDVGRQFRPRSWVSAANKRDPRELLMGILRELGLPVVENSNIDQLTVDLSEYLKSKRYLIVIDDMQTDQWSTIESAFPEDASSRIVVTTTIKSVANACSSSNGYVYRMKRLGDEYSKQLFAMKAYRKNYLGCMKSESKDVLKKCDGQPLALITVGHFLRKKGWPTDPSCEDLCKQLRRHLKHDETLQRMWRVLHQTFSKLPCHGSRACLLYFGMFPCDHSVSRKTLMRRWLAEGFVETQPSSSEKFNTLIDQNIIEPIGVRSNDQVKTCRTYGMMHEFILHMSTSQDFITLFSGNKAEGKYVRRLSLHDSGATSRGGFDIDLSLVRSLMVRGEASKDILNFQKYQLLRVLDLEQCTDLGDYHLKDICNLLLLKYLSLGETITSIPKEIKNLKLLETLDLRRTKVNMLPIEVLMLPCLVHLIGNKLQLPDRVDRVKKFCIAGKSNLETLSGFTTNGCQGFPLIMTHMMNLRKVKIWFGSERSTNSTDLVNAIQKFIHDDKKECKDPRSLSLCFEDCFETVLHSLKSPCYLRSLKLKLKGNLLELPQFVISLRGLQDLCLSSAKLTPSLLTALSQLTHLQHLKLIADELEDFILTDQAFPELLRLCFVLKSSNALPRIEEGALPHLMSLKLICKDLDGLADIKINCLQCLKEVTLDANVTQETIDAWKKAAMEHPNRPKILLFNPVDESESEPAEGCIASTTTECEAREASTTSEAPVQVYNAQMLDNKGSIAEEKRKKNCTVESSSNDALNSAFAAMDLSEVPLTSNEFSVPRNSRVSSYTC
ncbi:unnamed protein product [Urochloa humidicola]